MGENEYQFDWNNLGWKPDTENWTGVDLAKKAVDLGMRVSNARETAKGKLIQKAKVPFRDNSAEVNDVLDLQTRLFNEGLLGTNVNKAIDGKIGARTKRALNVSLLRLLIKLGLLDNSKGNADDGIMGNNSNNALAEALKQGYVLKNGKLIKKDLGDTDGYNEEKPKLILKSERKESTSTNEEESFLDLTKHYLKSSIPYRVISHKTQAIKNGINKIGDEIEKGNYGKALYSYIGTSLDVATSNLLNAQLLKIAPMYGMGMKDVPNALFNRLGRKIFNDDKYTAIKGQTYTNDDFSDSFNDIAANAISMGGNLITPMLRRDVDPKMTYGDTKAILHVFNPTANYAMSVGQVSPHKNKQGNYTTDDPYDNSTASNNWYAKSPGSVTDVIRGVAGMMTSNEDFDPLEGKQRYTFEFSPYQIREANKRINGTL